MRTVDGVDLRSLTTSLRGPVFTRDDDGYDVERAGFQTARWHRPDLIVGATGPADIRAAVSFAADQGLPVGVQGTGHAVLAVAAAEGVLINTRRMRGVRVNSQTGTAWLGAGVRWDQVIHEAAQFGLAPLSGSAPHVGAVSYILGGGLGLLSRRYGYAADHVRSLDVVTADGELRHVTARFDPDLFWALRGGRDNFGIVTGLEIDLMPVERFYGGSMTFDLDEAAEVVEAYVQWTEFVPDELSSSIALISFPDAATVPPRLRGRRIVQIRIAYLGGAEAGERLVAPLRAIATPTIDTLAELPYSAAGTIHNDPVEPVPTEGDNLMLGPLGIEAAATLFDLVRSGAPVPHVVELRHLGGALACRPAAGNAIGHRSAHFVLVLATRSDMADADVIRYAHTELLHTFSRWSAGGQMLNFMTGERGAQHVRNGYDPEDYQRLATLKSRYDPANIFRLNHNIPPVALTSE
ncbi:FAD-binding oxidoreductase [Nocardia sp. NPDC051052]|uniref:FAD-binding oxidoreductase n=1 Tax=Nocardia sp. NPDC051052 TaxID=3364322 RepID=UPI00379CBE84